MPWLGIEPSEALGDEPRLDHLTATLSTNNIYLKKILCIEYGVFMAGKTSSVSSSLLASIAWKRSKVVL